MDVSISSRAGDPICPRAGSHDTGSRSLPGHGGVLHLQVRTPDQCWAATQVHSRCAVVCAAVHRDVALRTLPDPAESTRGGADRSGAHRYRLLSWTPRSSAGTVRARECAKESNGSVVHVAVLPVRGALVGPAVAALPRGRPRRPG